MATGSGAGVSNGSGKHKTISESFDERHVRGAAPSVKSARRLQVGRVASRLISLMLLAMIAGTLGADSITSGQTSATQADKTSQQLQHVASGGSAGKAALEAELNAILQRHAGSLESTNGHADSGKNLADAIISRILVDNLTTDSDGSPSDDTNELASGTSSTSGALGGLNEVVGPLEPANVGEILLPAEGNSQQSWSQLAELGQASNEDQASRAEVQRMRTILGYLQSVGAGYPAVGQYSLLPSGQMATMKRAALKLAGAYLGQQQRQSAAGSPRAGQQMQALRNSYEFGLGKRPDMNQASNLLRFGDASLPVGGSGMVIQPVNQFGKRPSAHRYDFGLGKRVVNQAYPTRYDFGLGKRVPNKLRYDFGLGR